MRVTETVWAAYLLLSRNLASFLSIALAWVLMSAIPSAIALLGADADLPESDDATLIAIAPTFLTLLLSIAGSVCMAIVWYRFVIRGEPVARLFPETTEVIPPYVTRLLVASLPTVVLATLIYWFSWDTVTPIQGASIYVGTSLLFAATARFLLILPASATGDTATTARASWRATDGQTLALFLGLLACDLPFTTVIVAIDYVTFAYDLDSLKGIAAFAVTQVLDLARNVVWAAFMSRAYLQFMHPVQRQADHFR